MLDRSTYYASWPISAPVQIQYTFYTSVWNFCPPARCRCELGAKLACSVESRISSSFVQEPITNNGLLIRFNTCFCICFLRLWREIGFLKSDYFTWKWHPNRIYTRFLSYGSIERLLLSIKLGEKWYCCLRTLIFLVIF